MKKLVRKVTGMAVSLAMVVVMGMPAFASTYYGEKTIVHNCGRILYSYGVQYAAIGTTSNRHSGEYCDFCEKTIPEGETHAFHYHQDEYFFRCNSCNVVVTRFYKCPIDIHYTNGVQDYY